MRKVGVSRCIFHACKQTKVIKDATEINLLWFGDTLLPRWWCIIFLVLPGKF